MVDPRAGQAIISHNEKWYLVSIDRGWKPCLLGDEASAFRWALNAIPTEKEQNFLSMRSATKVARSICLQELQLPETTTNEIFKYLSSDARQAIAVVRARKAAKRRSRKTYTKSMILQYLVAHTGISARKAGDTLDALVNLAYKQAKNSFTIPGLGKLVLVQRKARLGRSFAFGGTYKLPATKTVKFKISAVAKKKMLSSSKRRRKKVHGKIVPKTGVAHRWHSSGRSKRRMSEMAKRRLRAAKAVRTKQLA
jgi:DNA-binding protein HU-beta